MFVQHTQAMMEEIEMEDADEDEEERVINIDACDEKNPLAVIEYINDIYDFFKKSEVSVLFLIIQWGLQRFMILKFMFVMIVQELSCVPPNYMDNQQDLNERMRGILIDWLIEVHRSRPKEHFSFILIVVEVI